MDLNTNILQTLYDPIHMSTVFTSCISFLKLYKTINNKFEVIKVCNAQFNIFSYIRQHVNIKLTPVDQQGTV